MQNIQNIFGIPNVQQHFNLQQQQPQPQQQQMQQQMQQPQHRPVQQQQQQQAAPAPAVKRLADAPICNPNASSKELYAVENAIKKDYNPITKQWEEENIKIQIERKPFAEGAMRAAYRMKIIEGMDVHGIDRYFVLKLSKDPHEPTRQYYKDVETQMESRKWALEYNKKGVPKEVDFIPAYVVILSDRPMKPTCTMERHVEGDYVKYNDNWSWCDEKRNTPQAFSHFTWEASGNKLLICDLQGVGDCWTDPQIHTVDGKGFGKGNAGLQGVRQFMRQHKCNAICRALKLQSVTGRVKTGDVGTQWGAALKRRCGVIAEQYKAAAAAQDHKAERVPALVGVGISGQLQRGDFIVQVDDIAVQGASVSAVKRLIQGAPGTSVTLHLMRGIKSYSVTLMREAAPPSTVASEKKRKVHERVKELMDGKGHEDGVVSPDVRAAQGNKRPPQVPRAHPLPTPPVDHPPVAIEKDKENIAQLDNNLQPDPHIMQKGNGMFNMPNMNALFGMPVNQAVPRGNTAADGPRNFLV